MVRSPIEIRNIIDQWNVPLGSNLAKAEALGIAVWDAARLARERAAAP